MAQVTTGIRSILSYPWVYEWLQKIMGADKSRSDLIAKYVEPYRVKTVLDIGCGPAEILSHMPGVDYYGFDISSDYIEKAKHTYGAGPNFFDRNISIEDLNLLPSFDLVLMLGVLHHLDDDVAKTVIQTALQALKLGGRLLTVDPCFEKGQNPIAKFLISQDRGQNVRTKHEYSALVEGQFDQAAIEVNHLSWIPYTHCIMECTRL
jgi:SAM-dependent methyltransferase